MNSPMVETLKNPASVAMRRFAASLSMLALSGCAGGQVRNPVPAALAERAHVPGLAAARFWYDEKLITPDQTLRRLGLHTLSNTVSHGQSHPEVNYLALSGGADDGAFGAGLLVGWSRSGTRPKFDVVTGISAGALIAPFAFLGENYDRQLRAMWFNHTSEDLYRSDVELSPNLGDGRAGQAAAVSGRRIALAGTSNPSLNFTPRMSFGNWA